jgi:hypothetical protein
MYFSLRSYHDWNASVKCCNSPHTPSHSFFTVFWVNVRLASSLLTLQNDEVCRVEIQHKKIQRVLNHLICLTAGVNKAIVPIEPEVGTISTIAL